MNDWVYQEQGHKYLCDGVEKPSVTRLVSFAVGNIYKGVPSAILERKANFGTYVHQVIQNYVLGIDQEVDKDAINLLAEFIMLTDGIKFTEVEKMVTYEDRFGGRLDLMDEYGFIYDIKTTSKIHKENLEWQLGFYYLANGKNRADCVGIGRNGEQTPFSIPYEIGYCIWLPKGKEGKMVEIKPKTKTECLELLRRYETDSKI